MVIFSFVCFLLLLLYGIELLSSSLENKLNGRFLKIIHKFTSNIYISFVTGVILTFCTQSSSCITAIVIAFLNSNKLNLKNAISIILGANIGTSFTSIITSLNFDSSSFIILSCGLILYFFKKTKHFSTFFIGLGFIFISIYYLKQDLVTILNKINYSSYFVKSNNSILLSTWNGILISGIIQSSSATIGLAQIAANNRLISLMSAICIVLGANIGTTFTGLVASINSSKDSKALSISHLLLNLIGTILALPFVRWFSTFTVKNIPLYLSFVHILFNVVSSILGIIFISPLMRLSFLFIKKDT